MKSDQSINRGTLIIETHNLYNESQSKFTSQPCANDFIHITLKLHRHLFPQWLNQLE